MTAAGEENEKPRHPIAVAGQTNHETADQDQKEYPTIAWMLRLWMSTRASS